jgi:molybdenum cofactor biosynthesis protein MoaC
MIDVGAKEITRRIARASGRITLRPESYLALKERRLPKGDALPLAETAGVFAAKNTSGILPLCHNIPLDYVRFEFDFDDNERSLVIYCEAAAHARTGVEMEALSGAMAALLCVYDLAKAVDPVIVISDLHLLTKTGGKKGVWHFPGEEPTGAPIPEPIRQGLAGIRCAVITISDTVSQGQSEDKSGPALCSAIVAAGGNVVETRCVADDEASIARLFVELVNLENVDIIVSTGGTGAGPRDVTPEALSRIAEKIIPGFGEMMRSEGLKSTPRAALSRSGCGVLQGKLILCLPGSVRGAVESLEIIEQLLVHTLQIVRGAKH